MLTVLGLNGLYMSHERDHSGLCVDEAMMMTAAWNVKKRNEKATQPARDVDEPQEDRWYFPPLYPHAELLQSVLTSR